LNNLAEPNGFANMGVDDFVRAIASFNGASKRLEKIAESRTKVAYKDFAHSPVKVATTKAVRNNTRSNLGSLFRVTHV
jgi:UDP-N-acetylmuramate: L-alanyl-gamma-D-glutamyl-meso-diaminopimelate ligase